MKVLFVFESISAVVDSSMSISALTVFFDQVYKGGSGAHVCASKFLIFSEVDEYKSGN